MVVIFVVFIVAVAAGLWDYRSYRIPNWLTLGAAGAGLLIAILGVGAPGGPLDSVKGLLAGGLIMLPFFMLGAMGGGDVKLSAAFGALGGLYFVINALLTGSILGGVFALYLICRKSSKNLLKKVQQDHAAISVSSLEARDREMVLPYGVFISAGAVISLFYEVIEFAA